MNIVTCYQAFHSGQTEKFNATSILIRGVQITPRKDLREVYIPKLVYRTLEMLVNH